MQPTCHHRETAELPSLQYNDHKSYHVVPVTCQNGTFKWEIEMGLRNYFLDLCWFLMERFQWMSAFLFTDKPCLFSQQTEVRRSADCWETWTVHLSNVMTCLSVSFFRHPPDDGAVRASSRVRVHSLHEADRPMPLPRALPWRCLYTGCLPSPVVWEEPDPADQRGPFGWPQEQGPGHSPWFQHRPVRRLRCVTQNSCGCQRARTHILAFAGPWRERCNKATEDTEAEAYKI